MEGASEVDGRWMRAGRRAVCPDVLGCAASLAAESTRRRPRWTGALRPVLLPADLGVPGSCRDLYVAVRGIGPAGAPACVHIVYSAPGMSIIQHRLCRSEAIWRCRQERTVKPSAQPTLVRTQHLPPPAKTAHGLRKRGPAGRFLLVTACIRMRHYGSTHGSVRVHMVYSVRAKLAVRITARFRNLVAVGYGKTRSAGGKPGNFRSTGAVLVSGRSFLRCALDDPARPCRIAAP